MQLKGRRILITGAARGIGQATAELFVREGAQVALLDRNAAGVRANAARLGGIAIEADVRDEAQVEAAVKRAAEAMGGLDGLVNSAGVANGISTLADTDLATWRDAIDTNLTGTFLVCRAALPWLRQAGQAGGQATIVNLASAQAIHPTGSSASYAASKGGVVTFSKNISIELAPQGVRVNVVCPGTTDTPMVEELMAGANPEAVKRNLVTVPMGRLARASEQADAILFFTSAQSAFVTGATLAPDGGRTRH